MITDRPTVALIVSCPDCRCLHASRDPCPRCAQLAADQEGPAWPWLLGALLVSVVAYVGLWRGVMWLCGG